MAKTNKKEEEKTADEPTGAYAQPVAPEFTIRANSAFGILAMMAIARMPGVSHEERKALQAKLREFDLYEELTRK